MARAAWLTSSSQAGLSMGVYVSEAVFCVDSHLNQNSRNIEEHDKLAVLDRSKKTVS